VTRVDVLQSAEVVLRRAGATDLEGVLALQQAAYAKNRPLLGVEPIPLLADYAHILRTMEVWVHEGDGRLLGALILEPRPDDLLIWSIAAHPSAQGTGIGGALLAAADARARQIGRPLLRLYTGSPLAHLVAWYGRHGYAIERIEALSDRSITHMIKHLGPPLEP
jgi:GNAT superfamily N-acetyltransferase